MDKSKPKIVHMDDYKRSQGHLEKPYGECGCGGDSFGLILSDWSEDADVFALRCFSCNAVVELGPSIVVECVLE